MKTATATLQVNSFSFSHKGNIPEKYTCEGDDINPSLEISDIPPGTQTLAIIMEDPDVPKGTFDHWLVWNIEPHEDITENSSPGISGINSFGKTGYGGPCPPSGTHRYYFKVFALDKTLDLQAGSDKKALLEAMDGHILAQGEIMGHYKKRNS
jgi:Raf kinase inhibitor-like YbhB/YbcL family protein